MATHDSGAIVRQLVEYLSNHADVGNAFDEQSNLAENGVLDSLLITDLVLHMESEFAIKLTARDISPEHFGNVQQMARLVACKQAKAKRAA